MKVFFATALCLSYAVPLIFLIPRLLIRFPDIRPVFAYREKKLREIFCDSVPSSSWAFQAKLHAGIPADFF